MAQQTLLLPGPRHQVLNEDGSFRVEWYRFFVEVAADILQIADCIVMAGPLRANFLKCDGTAVSRTTYAKLFSVIGITFGPGDGVTTFNLPNFASPGAPSFWAIHYQ